MDVDYVISWGTQPYNRWDGEDVENLLCVGVHSHALDGMVGMLTIFCLEVHSHILDGMVRMLGICYFSAYTSVYWIGMLKTHYFSRCTPTLNIR